MPFCSKCGGEIQAGTLYCRFCGARLNVCPSCEAKLAFDKDSKEHDRTKLHYEKALEIRYHEVDLLFQRFNFFMVGMSFLVAAFAAIVATGHPEKLHNASGAIAGFGAALSFGFFLINLYNSYVITKFDDYIKQKEMPDGPFNRILSIASIGCPKAFHTWLLPIIYLFFWAVMISFWCIYTW
jgi:hypothetical protein